MQPEEIDIQLQPKQADLLALLRQTGPNTPTWLGCGGSRGSAKSGGLRRIAIALAFELPGVVIYIIRRVLGDLLENHMEKIALEYPAIDAMYRPGDYEYDLPGGSRIVYVYAENGIDVKRVSYGPECTFLFIDQAEQFTEDELTSFRICNRWPDAPEGLVKTCLFFNSGVGMSADFLRRIFWLKKFRANESPEDYRFQQMFGWDNFEWFRGQIEQGSREFYQLSSADRFDLFIAKTSEGKKMNALPPHRRVSELLGTFDSFSGQYFSGVWDEELCTITAAKVDEIVQPWWTAWMAQDWGFGDHDCHLWFAAGKMSPADWVRHFGGYTEWPIDVVIIYREYVINNRAEADLAMDIVERTPEHERKAISSFVLSSDAFGRKARQAGAHSIGQQFTEIMQRHRLPSPEPADQSPGSRVVGWRYMYNCLRQANMRGTEITQERSKEGPALLISTACPEVISAIPQAVRDEDDREDVMRVDGILWEDVTDAVRYGLNYMLSPKTLAPVGVRRQEALAAAAGISMNAVAMADRQFKAKEAQRTAGRARWR